jgi:hypothetical protein
MINTAAVTRPSFALAPSSLLAMPPRLAYIRQSLFRTKAIDGLPATA